MPDTNISPGLHRHLVEEFTAAAARGETDPRQLADHAMRLVSGEVAVLGDEIQRLNNEAAIEWPPCPDLTVDMVVLAGLGPDPHLLMIKRGDAPYRGCYALPGGYTVAGEHLVDAVRREVVEETGLEVGVLERVGVYDAVGRDPRGHVVSVAYATTLAAVQEVRAGDDAAAAEWIPLGDVLRDAVSIAFDHWQIVTDAAEQFGFTGIR